MKQLDPRYCLIFSLLCACPADDDPDGNDGTTSTDPSTTEPSTTEPSTTEPSTTEPSTTESSTTEPSTTEPSTTEPSTTESSTSDADSSTSDDSSTTQADTSTTDPTKGGDAVVVLNELSSNNDGKLGEDPIEVYNAGDEAADLSGWIITDDVTDPYDPEVDEEEYVFPDGTMLEPGAFLVVYGGDLPDGHPFGLSGGGDTVRLFDPSLSVVDVIEYADGRASTSYCRIPDGPDGVWQSGCTESFGASNG